MYTNILLATDLSEMHFNICEKAVKVASLLQAKLYILHVVEVPAGVQLAQGLGFTELAQPSTDDAWTVMRILGDALNIPSEQLMVERGGAVGDIIAQKIHQLDCDLILVGNHTSENLPSLIGSTTSYLILHAPCDVMTLRNV